jgi:hypothetical protein
MDVVYILGPGSTWNDNELLYSLRSVRKHLRGFRKIFVVGSMPRVVEHDDECGFVWVPAEDKFGDARQHNVRAKLIHAAHNPDISDEFLLMNDDFFFLAPVDISEIPYYRQGTLPQHIEWREERGGAYLETLRNTERILRHKNLPVVDFELHVPIRFKKGPLSNVLDDDYFDWSPRAGLCFRSLYCNLLGIKGQPIGDVKIDAPLERSELDRRMADNTFLSIGPAACTKTMETVLKERFPDRLVAS